MGCVADDDGVRVEVLGPIRVFDAGGREITPDGALQRRLLALLVLRRGRTVSVEAAIDALWPAGPPRDPSGALHNQVFRLRRRLPDGLIESDGDGYRLMSTRVDVDADRLADVLNAGPAGPDEMAAIDAALVRWQGPAYPELDDVDEGRVEATRLAELRVRALEVRAERRLAAGEVDAAIAELAALAHDEPLRERPRELLMTALADAGRQAEALRVYDDFRRLLGAELGIEPSPSLTAQHAELLAGAGVAAWAAVDRLPVPATSLVGREELAADVHESLERHRVVTLIGPGGVGKTRLAVDVGHRLLAARPDRPVIMCELSVATPASAVDTVAEALRIDVRPGVSTIDRVAAVVGDSDVVVMLDNCEHVLDPIAELVDGMVARCPHVRVLATSRERLRVSGERVVAVPSLPGDDEGPAVQLFLERALAVAPDFTPTGAELAGVAEIVRRLDGLPLAIELAAARLHTHDVAEVAAGLDRRFALLTSGSRTTTRHGSLGAAVSWSVGLLDEHLQRTFTELSVFAGPFTAADAAAVCGSDPAGDRRRADPARRAVAAHAGARSHVRAAGDPAGVRRRATRRQRPRRRGRPAPRAPPDRLDRARRSRGCSTEGAAVTAEIDVAVPELRTALELAARPRRGRGGRPARDLAARLRRAATTPGRAGVGVPRGRRRPRGPQPLGGLRLGRRRLRRLDDRRGGGDSRRAQRAIDLSTASGGSIPPRVAVIRGNAELFEGRLDDAATWYRRAVESAGHDVCARVLRRRDRGARPRLRGRPCGGRARRRAARRVRRGDDPVRRLRVVLRR